MAMFEEADVIVDCDRCEVRGAACGDCVVGVLLGLPGVRAADPPGEGAPGEQAAGPSGSPVVHLDAPERRALDVLADQGLVPRLRLVVAPAGRPAPGPGPAEVRDVG
ncbi:MAG TPA: hypothetical protein VM367_16915 [Pseudonocardia sp.]|nr:hypothetical protein [Pseudonocardia sp.]